MLTPSLRGAKRRGNPFWTVLEFYVFKSLLIIASQLFGLPRLRKARKDGELDLPLRKLVTQKWIATPQKNWDSQRRRLEFGSPQIIPHRLCEPQFFGGEAIQFSPVRPSQYKASEHFYSQTIELLHNPL